MLLLYPSKATAIVTIRLSQISFSVTHEWSAFGGPTMVGRTSDWKEELGRFQKIGVIRLKSRVHPGNLGWSHI
jgi:hypothetical protein